jgi:glycosyltransferase involved in cell wall biosynthesis
MKVRYYGHAGQLTGYGRAAEMMCLALVRAGVDLEIRTLAPYDGLRFEGPSLPLANLLKRDGELDRTPDAVIVHTLPLDCPRVIAMPDVRTTIDSCPALVAYTTWEATSAPKAVVWPFETFDAVWHPSSLSADAFRAESVMSMRRKIHVMPHCYDEESLASYRAPLVSDTAGLAYRFYTVGAFTARKNALSVIRAFVHAFDKSDNVELLMVCSGMSQMQLTQAICSTGFSPDQIPPIRSDFKPISEADLWKLHRGADCFVSASRGEAWNLPAFEAVLAGRHVIAPLGLGHEEFLCDTSAAMYPAKLTPAMVDVRMVQDPSGSGGVQVSVVGAQGLTSKSLWYEPDLFVLADLMRRAYQSRRRTIDLEYDLARYGSKVVGANARAKLDLLVAQKGTGY